MKKNKLFRSQNRLPHHTFRPVQLLIVKANAEICSDVSKSLVSSNAEEGFMDKTQCGYKVFFKLSIRHATGQFCCGCLTDVKKFVYCGCSKFSEQQAGKSLFPFNSGSQSVFKAEESKRPINLPQKCQPIYVRKCQISKTFNLDIVYQNLLIPITIVVHCERI